MIKEQIKNKETQNEKNLVLLKLDRLKKKIYVEHPYSPHLHHILSATKKGFWLKKQSCWFFPYDKQSYAALSQLKEVLVQKNFTDHKEKTKLMATNDIAASQLNSATKDLLVTYSNTVLLKRLSPKTRDIYMRFLFCFCKNTRMQT